MGGLIALFQNNSSGAPASASPFFHWLHIWTSNFTELENKWTHFQIAAHESYQLLLGFHKDELPDGVGMDVETGVGTFLKFDCAGHTSSRLEKIELNDGKNEWFQL